MKTFASFIMLVTLITGIGASAQAQKSTAAKPTIIFVHGLWADGSSWSKVAAPLLADCDTRFRWHQSLVLFEKFV